MSIYLALFLFLTLHADSTPSNAEDTLIKSDTFLEAPSYDESYALDAVRGILNKREKKSRKLTYEEEALLKKHAVPSTSTSGSTPTSGNDADVSGVVQTYYGNKESNDTVSSDTTVSNAASGNDHVETGTGVNQDKPSDVSEGNKNKTDETETGHTDGQTESGTGVNQDKVPAEGSKNKTGESENGQIEGGTGVKAVVGSKDNADDSQKTGGEKGATSETYKEPTDGTAANPITDKGTNTDTTEASPAGAPTKTEAAQPNTSETTTSSDSGTSTSTSNGNTGTADISSDTGTKDGGTGAETPGATGTDAASSGNTGLSSPATEAGSTDVGTGSGNTGATTGTGTATDSTTGTGSAGADAGAPTGNTGLATGTGVGTGNTGTYVSGTGVATGTTATGTGDSTTNSGTETTGTGTADTGTGTTDTTTNPSSGTTNSNTGTAGTGSGGSPTTDDTNSEGNTGTGATPVETGTGTTSGTATGTATQGYDTAHAGATREPGPTDSTTPTNTAGGDITTTKGDGGATGGDGGATGGDGGTGTTGGDGGTIGTGDGSTTGMTGGDGGTGTGGDAGTGTTGGDGGTGTTGGDAGTGGDASTTGTSYGGTSSSPPPGEQVTESSGTTSTDVSKTTESQQGSGTSTSSTSTSDNGKDTEGLPSETVDSAAPQDEASGVNGNGVSKETPSSPTSSSINDKEGSKNPSKANQKGSSKNNDISVGKDPIELTVEIVYINHGVDFWDESKAREDYWNGFLSTFKLSSTNLVGKPWFFAREADGKLIVVSCLLLTPGNENKAFEISKALSGDSTDPTNKVKGLTVPNFGLYKKPRLDIFYGRTGLPVKFSASYSHSSTSTSSPTSPIQDDKGKVRVVLVFDIEYDIVCNSPRDVAHFVKYLHKEITRYTDINPDRINVRHLKPIKTETGGNVAVVIDILAPATPTGGTDIEESTAAKVAKRLLDLSRNNTLSLKVGRILQFLNADSSLVTPLSDTAFMEMNVVVSKQGEYKGELMRGQVGEDKKQLKRRNIRTEKVLKESDQIDDLNIAFVDIEDITSKNISTPQLNFRFDFYAMLFFFCLVLIKLTS